MSWLDLSSSFSNEDPSNSAEEEEQSNDKEVESTSIDDVRKNGGLREPGEPKENGRANKETLQRVKEMSQKQREEAIADVSNEPLDDVLSDMDGGVGNAIKLAEYLDKKSPSEIGSRKAAQVENQSEDVNQDDHSRTHDFSDKQKRRDQQRDRGRRDR